MRERFPSLDADDVIQETLIELIRVFPVYRYSPKEKGHFRNYLTGILRHRALRMIDEEKRRAKLAEEMRRDGFVVPSGGSPSLAAAPCQAGRSPSLAAVATAPVLIDLGLVKDLSAVRGHVGESLSIVDGQAVGVGTPRYAAPEQMSGDTVSSATDVYALGMLANDCFGGKPPRTWRRIIQRATVAVPAQRYATVEAFAHAIKFLRVRYWIGGTLVAVLVAAAIFLWPFLTSVTSATKEPVNEKSLWQSLCRNVTTNIVTWHSEMRRPDAVRRMSPGEFIMRANSPDCRPVVTSWAETNKIDVAMVNLGGRTVLFNEPIKLDAGREYWIVGPGVLDAQFSASSTATVRIANCIFRNRTKIRPSRTGIDYVLNGGAYLNFTEFPATEAIKLEAHARIRSNGTSKGRNWWRIKGPEGIPELMAEELDSPAYSATMESF